MRRVATLLMVLGALWQSPFEAVSKELYVAMDGDDNQAGTQDAPLATLQKAAQIMRDQGPGTIWIGPGEYYLPNGVVLESQHSGTAEEPLVIRGTKPHTSRLVGGQAVTDFRPITPEAAKPLISEEAKLQVVVADLAAQGFPKLADMPLQHRAHQCEELIVDDQPMQSARWPNEGFTEFTEVIDSGASMPIHWVRREVYRPGSFRFPNDRAKLWDFERGIWLHGFWTYDWSDEAIKAASYDAESGELRLAAKHAYGVGSPYNKNDRRRFYALHVFEELDQPGEYYLDRQSQRLYFWPPGDLSASEVRLTLCTSPIIRATEVSHLVIRDLVIENGRQSGVELQDCQHTRIERCLVRNFGRNGISLSGHYVVANDCEVTQTASCGISVTGGDRKMLTPGGCAVVDCHVHHVGRLDWMGGRGVSIHGCGNRMANNLIHHCPTGGVSYGGNEHLLELNEVRDVCLLYSDVGVFYTGRDWASRGNIVRWNYIHDVANNAGHGSSGIYLDDCDSGDTVIGNIVCGGVGRGVLLGGGRDNTICGNIFVDLPVGIHVDARGKKAITLDQPGSWNLLAKCEQVGYLSPLWKERYPRLAEVMRHEPRLPMGNTIHSNLLVGCRQPFALSSDVKPEWLDRQDNVEWPTTKLPAIANSPDGSLDLTQLSASWHKVRGFEPIPIEKIGLLKD
ncbi:right-handed parallel beta-helix repeat-containing protein [Aeoliella sp. ICT_H6.2]|uniref:Right-handed parallel beta-helix repeat-containing protein n=1 Tax=Aeoliella straminimaris TaxID=2954799 RepID=A0A9X2F8J9_9BACT|nr:right-handed parallel beta-helix repeat-containing protein [Aeoliella straminimaris]MCO6044342.1 right-handed parallel beta-helix repeat-containing protein [Aeoliella straminimaris]